MSEPDPEIPGFPPRPRQHFSLPPKPRSSALGLTVGILIILVLLVGGGVAIKMLLEKQAPPPATQTIVIPGHSGPAAGVPVAPKPPAAPTSRAGRPAQAASAEPEVEPTTVAPADPATEAWERVQQTYRTSPPEMAIVALQDFLQLAPNSTFAPLARKQIDESLDRLWWHRIKQLCEQRDTMNKRLADVNKQIAIVKQHGAVAERLAELQGERAPFEAELTKIQSRLSERKYADSRTPDPHDEAQLTELRKLRDAATYEQWKKTTLSYIKRTRGRVPA